MKKILAAGLMAFAASCFAGDAPPPNPVTIVKVPGFTKLQIYKATKDWIAQNFHSANKVSQDW